MPRKRIAYVCTDEANSAKAGGTAFTDDVAVHAVPVLSWLPEWGYDAVAYDLDHIDPEQRRRLIAKLTSKTPRRPTAVHSYNLDDVEARKLKARGVLVGRGLEDSLLQGLAALIPAERRRAG
jgi:hypothetical protein